jgi:hypothetical protein
MKDEKVVPSVIPDSTFPESGTNQIEIESRAVYNENPPRRNIR